MQCTYLLLFISHSMQHNNLKLKYFEYDRAYNILQHLLSRCTHWQVCNVVVITVIFHFIIRLLFRLHVISCN